MGKRSISVLFSALLMTAMFGLAAGASASDHQAPRTKTFVGGGAALSASVPQDPVTVTEETAAAGAASCHPLDVLPGPIDIPEPVLAPHVGGACFSTAPFEDAPGLTVDVDRFYVTIPEYPNIGFAAGYDLDGDGCIGCTAVDALWVGDASLTVPVLEGAPTLAVFVYAVDAQSDTMHRTPPRTAKRAPSPSAPLRTCPAASRIPRSRRPPAERCPPTRCARTSASPPAAS